MIFCKTTSLIILIFFNALISTETLSHVAPNRFQVNIPTVQKEIDSIWRTITDISFFDEHGYTVNLPDHSFIETLLAKSRNGSLKDQDFEKLKVLFRDEIYNPQDYAQSVYAVKTSLSLANKILNEISMMDLQWPFKFFKSYEIQLTLYGSGGSYRPDTGTIILLTNKKGGFKNYKDPINNIIHELVHIGVEDSIVQELSLSHPMKEQVIDTFIKVAFTEELPDYRVQPMGEASFSKTIHSKNDLLNYKHIISEFIAQQ
ncbi:hypothetical protein [Marinicella sp. W31]|uniref:hypothetical protein n=1 Tax=Marinicella sp. W31 TaxID=3023713 RepID=UPI0037578049